MKATAHEIFDEHVTTNHKARFFSQLFYCVEECNDFVSIAKYFNLIDSYLNQEGNFSPIFELKYGNI